MTAAKQSTARSYSRSRHRNPPQSKRAAKRQRGLRKFAKAPNLDLDGGIDALLQASDEDTVLKVLSHSSWISNGKAGECPGEREASVKSLSTWLESQSDSDSLLRLQQQSERRLQVCSERAGQNDCRKWTWVGCSAEGGDSHFPEQLSLCASDGTEEQLIPDGVMYAHRAWVTAWHEHGTKNFNPPRHPLAPLVRAWQKQPRTVRPDRSTKGIMPATMGTRVTNAGDRLPVLVPPECPGPMQAGELDMLPAITSDRDGTPALILSLFSQGGGQVSRRGRASVEARLYVELLLSVLRRDRQIGGLVRLPISVEEIVEDWLQWDTKHYRPRRADSGGALRTAAGRLRDIWVPVGSRGGGFFPVLFSGATGWHLCDHLEFVLNLPDGSDVGPPVDRAMLRRLGAFAAAWYAYIALLFEWDRFGGVNGRLIRRNRPVALRDHSGNLVDAQGRVILGKGRIPVKHPSKTGRAVFTGDTELNPARTRYPTYDAGGLLRLCFEPRLIRRMSGAARRVHVQRAREAIKRIEVEGGCAIERLGNNRGNGSLPWRVMPPDYEALPDPSVIEQEA